MELEQYSKAYKAIQAGKNAYAQGLSLKDNPYTTGKFIGLKNWWEKGFNELKDYFEKK